MIRKGFTIAALALALLTACERVKVRSIATFVSETEVTWAADSARVHVGQGAAYGARPAAGGRARAFPRLHGGI